jgi:hypothetical protein
MSPAELEAMTELARCLPEANALLAEHVGDYGELLPHVLMADVRRLFVDLADAGEDEKVATLLAAVERLAVSSDDGVRNIVEVSFVGDLVLGMDAQSRRAIETTRSSMGPATTAALVVSQRSYG